VPKAKLVTGAKS